MESIAMDDPWCKIEELEQRLHEAEEVLRALREGKVDALVSYEEGDERVYTLKSADQGYRLLIESINEGAVILSADGSIYYGNPSVERMLRGECRNLVGTTMVDHIHPDDRAEFETLVRLALDGCTGTAEIGLVNGAGGFTPVYVSLSPLRMEEFRGACVVLTDITDRKRYMERIERSNQDLRDFAYVASHDLQEPLRKIQAFAGFLQEECDDSFSEHGRDYLRRVVDASGRMRAYILDLLKFSRVSTHAEPFEPLDMKAVLNDVVSDLQISIEEHNARVEVGDMPSIEADNSQMVSLFLNLIGNAIKFNTADQPVVVIRGEVLNGYHDASGDDASRPLCRIVVDDNGIGFDPQYAEHIFTPFFRLHRRDEYPGTGMGLAICKKIVERHGGTITAESTPGQGSRFIVTLPLNQSRAEDS